MKRFFVGLTLVVLGVVFAGCDGFFEVAETESGRVMLAPTTPAVDEGYGMQQVHADLGDVEVCGYLVLVNRDNAVDAAGLGGMVAAWPTVPVSVIDGMYLHPTALAAVAEMFEAARSEGISGLHVTSGFRSIEHQTLLYDGGRNPFALPPGHSEHHTGLAADIMAVGVSQAQFGNSEQGRWLAQNSWRFGLILRYPAGTEHITGVPYEPWHFRYVGISHAEFIFQNQIVLEEYLEILANR